MNKNSTPCLLEYFHVLILFIFYSLIQTLFIFSLLVMLLIRNLAFDINIDHYVFCIPVAPMARHILPDHPKYNGSRAEEAGSDGCL